MLQQRHTMSRRFTRLAAIALYLLVPPTAAIAAGDEMPALEEIVVTATRRSERLKMCPSVSRPSPRSGWIRRACATLTI